MDRHLCGTSVRASKLTHRRAVPSVGLDGTTQTGLGRRVHDLQSRQPVSARSAAELGYKVVPEVELVPGVRLPDRDGTASTSGPLSASRPRRTPSRSASPSVSTARGSFLEHRPLPAHQPAPPRGRLRPVVGRVRASGTTTTCCSRRAARSRAGRAGHRHFTSSQLGSSGSCPRDSRSCPTSSPSRGPRAWYHQPPQPQEALGLGTAPRPSGTSASWATTFGWEQRLTQAIQYDVDRVLPPQARQPRGLRRAASTGFGEQPVLQRWRRSRIRLRADGAPRPGGPVLRVGQLHAVPGVAARPRSSVRTPSPDDPENLLLGHRALLVPVRLRPDPHLQRAGRLRPAARLRHLRPGPVRHRATRHRSSTRASTMPTQDFVLRASGWAG